MMRNALANNSQGAAFPESWATAERIRQHLNGEGLGMWLFGSLAVWSLAGELRAWLECNRRAPADIDAVTKREYRASLRRIMTTLGFDLDHRVALATEGHIYHYEKTGSLSLEIHFDALEFCHRIPLRGYLLEDRPTISLAELTMSKLQIMETNERDARDSLALLHAFDLADAPSKEKEIRRLLQLLCGDWGAWYTVRRNLERSPDWLAAFGHDLPKASQQRILRVIDQLAERLRAAPKTLAWHLRSIIGPRLKWYRPVSERDSVM